MGTNNGQPARTATWQGRTQTVWAWANELGISYYTLNARLKSGWDVERAFTTVAGYNYTDWANDLKTCATCGESKPLGEFYRKFNRGLQEVYARCIACENERVAERRRDLRRRVIGHYSDDIFRCAHCGFDVFEALDLDHIDGFEGKRVDRDRDIYRRLEKQGFPEGFQVLCRNCNWLKFRLAS